MHLYWRVAGAALRSSVAPRLMHLGGTAYTFNKAVLQTKGSWGGRGGGARHMLTVPNVAYPTERVLMKLVTSVFCQYCQLASTKKRSMIGTLIP